MWLGCCAPRGILQLSPSCIGTVASDERAQRKGSASKGRENNNIQPGGGSGGNNKAMKKGGQGARVRWGMDEKSAVVKMASAGPGSRLKRSARAGHHTQNTTTGNRGAAAPPPPPPSG